MVSTASDTSDSLISLQDFLNQKTAHGTTSEKEIVIGNEAGDADSIISAITLAYLTNRTPVLSIARQDLDSQRPETSLLLKLAGIHLPSHMLDVSAMEGFFASNDPLKLTLVDHNHIQPQFGNNNWNVDEIMDHHVDAGKHLDCPVRNIAFDSATGQALVASTCTLVTERAREYYLGNTIPPSLGTLLLGVILLDSINMNPDAKKGTRRDKEAIEFLLEYTQWTELPPSSQSILKVSDDGKPSTEAFFNALQQSKFDVEFWEGLSTFDALRLDYKSFGSSKPFGISTVLVPGEHFIDKDDVLEGTLSFMQKQEIDFLAIMFSFEDDESIFRRQLLLCSTSGVPHQDLVSHLNSNGLALEDISQTHTASLSEKDDVTFQLFDQGLTKASRKQVAPIMVEFFN